MKTVLKFFIFPVFVMGFVSFHLAAQTDTLSLNGVQYKVIAPGDFNSCVDSGWLRTGERYVIDDSVMDVNGTRLSLMNTGVMNLFILAQPVKLQPMTRVRLYVQITTVNTLVANYVEARIDKLETPGPSPLITPSNSTLTLDGLNYKIYTPEEFDFYADAGQMKVDERYVIEDAVLTTDGTNLMLMNTGILNSFILSQPAALEAMTRVRIYVQITRVNTFITNYVEAKVIKLEKL